MLLIYISGYPVGVRINDINHATGPTWHSDEIRLLPASSSHLIALTAMVITWLLHSFCPTVPRSLMAGIMSIVFYTLYPESILEGF
jgi:hypothetical protein